MSELINKEIEGILPLTLSWLKGFRCTQTEPEVHTHTASVYNDAVVPERLFKTQK